MRFSKLLSIVLINFLLASCDDSTNYAPVTDLSTVEPIPSSGVHHVKQHETVYEIAWRYGLDYRAVVSRNQMKSPYHVQPGQVIQLRAQNKSHPTAHESTPLAAVSSWTWPAEGNIIVPFRVSHKGVNIAGYAGEPVYAASSGEVVYCGDGLRGYGNLIILKHNGEYLSAYAHNRAVFVKEGEWVKQGQKIAEMGNTGTDRVMLHFEIRRAGQPIDPVSFIMK